MRPSHTGVVPLVLLVDDAEDIREAVADMLTHETGCAVRAVCSGSEALAVLRAPHVPKPCLIVLDWMMPGMSGGAVLAELRRDAELAPIPVIVFSGAHEVHASGVRVFRKPRDLHRLVARVRERCDEVRLSPGSDEPAAAL